MGADRDYDAKVAAAGTPFGQAGNAPAVVPGSATDPFYHSTGVKKDVTVNGVTYYGAIDVGSTKPPAAGGVGSISAASGLAITGTERNAAKEAEARRTGYTAEYLASRGGINSQGYFNDTPISGQLTAEEQKQVRLPNGNTDTAAMAKILQQKQIAKLVSEGMSESDATARVSKEYGQYGIGGSSGAGVGGAGGASGSAGVGTPEQQAARQSAFDLLKLQFDEYGLGALVEPLRGLIQEGISPSEFAVRLRQTDPYKKRFAANAARISKGLRALSEAEYINLEDGYQTIMRNYGLPATYYTKGELGRQEGFEKFIAGDVSPAELEDRISIAQKRVINAAPQVTAALKQFYPDIKNADILAYTLDPEQGLANIQKKVLAAEIGGAAMTPTDASGKPILTTSAARAEELARYGVTAETARAGFGAIGGGLERGRQLSSIYQQPDYNQAVAEEEVFNLPGQTQAGQKRKKIIGLEKATFGGQTGVSSGALSQNRAGSY